MTQDLRGVTPLTGRKAKAIIERDDYQITGFVLTNASGKKCIVDMNAVRWFSEHQAFHEVMHPSSIKE